jgi:hypothetical protein
VAGRYSGLSLATQAFAFAKPHGTNSIQMLILSIRISAKLVNKSHNQSLPQVKYRQDRQN